MRICREMKLPRELRMGWNGVLDFSDQFKVDRVAWMKEKKIWTGY